MAVPSLSHRGAWALAAIGLALCFFGAWLSISNGHAVNSAVLFYASHAPYVIAGTLVLVLRPAYRLGPLMILTGYTVVFAFGANLSNSLLYILRFAVLGIDEVLLITILLTFPSGRFAGRLVRSAGVALWLSFAVLAFVTSLTVDPSASEFCRGCDRGPILEASDLLDTVLLAKTVVLAGFAVFSLALLVRRFLAASPAGRRMLAPVLLAGVLAPLAVWGTLLPFAGPEALFAGRVGLMGQAIVPFALLWGAVRAGLGRGAAADLLLAVGTNPSHERLESEVRRVLHDPSARVLARSAATDTFVDSHGQVALLPTGEKAPLATELGDATRPVGVLIHDAAVAEQPELLRAVSTALAVALQKERLEVSLRAQADAVADLPHGEVTFLFADIEGSTGLINRLGSSWGRLLSEHRQLMAEVVRQKQGHEVDARGDEYFAVFANAHSALDAALAVQRVMADHAWPDGNLVLDRIGLHTGTPDVTGEGYVGIDVHRVARLGNAGHGGQILVSETTQLLLRDADLDGVELVALGRFQLRGLPGSEVIFEVVGPGFARTVEPLRI